MRSKSTILISIVLISSTLLWAGNLQKVHPLDSPLYRNLATLYILQGKALPSTSLPYNEDEAKRLLDRIDKTNLTSEAELALYEAIRKELQPSRKQAGNLGYDISLDLTTEVYAHTNTSDFTAEQDWTYGYGERKSFGNLSFETWPVDSFYSYFELSLMNNFGVVSQPGYDPTNPNTQPNTLYGKTPLTTNIIMVAPNRIENIDLNFPYRAFVSLGSEHWNIQVGRDKLSWGAGKSGNLMVSNNMPYQQFGRFTTGFDRFKYTLLSSFYTHPQIYTASNAGANAQDLLGDGIKMFLAHRVEFRFLQDKLGLAVSESMMYQSATGSIDLRFLNPVGFYHNQYIRGNSNSMLVFEADYTPVKALNLYAQLAIDEIAFGEDVPPAANSKPNAFGYLAGVQGALGIGEGVFTYSLEGAYTDPFMYMREQYNPTTQQFGVGYDVIVRVLSHSMENLRYWQGYPYGGDAIVAQLNLGYEKPGKIRLEASTMFMVHGILDINSTWTLYNGSGTIVTTPTTENPFDNTETGSISYTLLPTFLAGYSLNEKLSGMAHIAVPIIWNKGNDPKALTYDVQLSLGVTYSI
ncbi:MAG: hypothetical protein VB056_03360 [Sphaerochaeta associata]|uniref:hypothetical protein n=1 Tax=Sphaerochaeta associata TaxID=1129264 RepID=UPI002B1EA2B0|nr:hypothetical protein [Sphaerochaeta associata]MEA5027895.1 hypothetical protein [Sphaerochaeta associata]